MRKPINSVDCDDDDDVDPIEEKMRRMRKFYRDRMKKAESDEGRRFVKTKGRQNERSFSLYDMEDDEVTFYD